MTTKRLSLAAALFVVFSVSAGLQARDRSVAVPRDRASADETQFTALQKQPKSKAKDAKTKKPRTFRGRLPQYYGQIGLSTKQRESIYGIQKSYREQLQMLEKQLRDLRAKQGTEIEAVLTPDQKQKLNDLLEAARKKREARKGAKSKAPAAKKTDTAKP